MTFREGFDAGLRSYQATLQPKISAMEDEIKQLKEDIDCFEGMKEGVLQRITDIVAERDERGEAAMWFYKILTGKLQWEDIKNDQHPLIRWPWLAISLDITPTAESKLQEIF